jgi:hypothetical protein
VLVSKRLLNYRHVPEDERIEIRNLLDQAGIEAYETPPDRFGLSAGALWVADASQHRQARTLLDAYQSERAARARAAFLQARAAGEVPGLWASLSRKPLHVLGLLILVLGVLFALSLPMLQLGR